MQDANFRRVCPKIMELLPLNHFEQSYKVLSGELLLQYQSDSIDTWHNYSPVEVDVQDTIFFEVGPRIMELLPLNCLEKSCPLNSSVTISRIQWILGILIH